MSIVFPQMEKGTPNMEAINKNMKKEMVDFVSFYRRFNNVSGKQSLDRKSVV